MPNADAPIDWLMGRVEIDAATDCWEWQGTRSATGYGYAWNPVDRPFHKEHAHRIAYKLLVGPIPDDLVVDHLCRNHPCCNPAHLELVTPAENVRRGLCVALKTSCPNGHPFTEDNVYTAPKSGWRSCRTCRKQSAAAHNPAANAARAAERAAARAKAVCEECGGPQPLRRKLGRFCSELCGQRSRRRAAAS